MVGELDVNSGDSGMIAYAIGRGSSYCARGDEEEAGCCEGSNRKCPWGGN